MAIADRIARLFRVDEKAEPYGVAGGLPRGIVGQFGNVGVGTPADWAYWNRYNGYPGTAFGTSVKDAVKRVREMPVSLLYARQPHLQTVVAFRARNMAQLPIHAYRIEDGVHGREFGPVQQLMNAPNAHQTGFELIRDLVTTLDLYGRAYWAVAPSARSASGWEIQPVPVEWVTPVGGNALEPAAWKVTGFEGSETRIPAANMVVFSAARPNSLAPVAPVEALREILAEQIAAWEYRATSWSKGAQVNAYVYRPADAPEWTDDDFNRFTESWHEFQPGGARAGETPVFEEGMELRRVGYSAREDEWAEVAKLSLQTVCSVFHVPPAMVGADNATSYASAREFRSMLYTETLGPMIREIEQRINQFVVPLVAPGEPIAVKFNIDAKLAGSFEEQAGVLSTATGAPWMTVNEARALRNLPPTEGGDVLVVPLNVTVGGQASPQSGAAPSIAVQNAIEAGKDETA